MGFAAALAKEIPNKSDWEKWRKAAQGLEKALLKDRDRVLTHVCLCELLSLRLDMSCVRHHDTMCKLLIDAGARADKQTVLACMPVWNEDWHDEDDDEAKDCLEDLQVLVTNCPAWVLLQADPKCLSFIPDICAEFLLGQLEVEAKSLAAEGKSLATVIGSAGLAKTLDTFLHTDNLSGAMWVVRHHYGVLPYETCHDAIRGAFEALSHGGDEFPLSFGAPFQRKAQWWFTGSEEAGAPLRPELRKFLPDLLVRVVPPKFLSRKGLCMYKWSVLQMVTVLASTNAHFRVVMDACVPHCNDTLSLTRALTRMVAKNAVRLTVEPDWFEFDSDEEAHAHVRPLQPVCAECRTDVADLLHRLQAQTRAWSALRSAFCGAVAAAGAMHVPGPKARARARAKRGRTAPV